MIIDSQFKPAWWLPGAHLQTIWPSLFRRDVHLDRTSEMLTLPDGDEIRLDWVADGDGPIVLMLHGLAGSSDSNYVKGLQLLAKQRGWRSVAVNFRGCGDFPNHRARSYHSGETTDIRFAFETIQQRFPKAKFAAVGYSLGGNVLLKWLGETQIQAFEATAAASVPLLLDACATHMDLGFSKVYRNYLIEKLKLNLQQKLHHLESIGRSDDVNYLKTLTHDLPERMSFWELDERITAPLHGFKSAKEYYTKSSSRQFLKNIQVPTLLLQAANDPFMPTEVIPKDDELSETITLEVSRSGGHVGFVSNKGFKPVYWVEQRIVGFLEKHL